MNSLRRKILSEINDLQYDKVIPYLSKVFSSMGISKYDGDNSKHFEVITKTLKMFGINTNSVGFDRYHEIRDKIEASFLQSPTVNHTDSTFIKDPKLFTFEVELNAGYNESGTYLYRGEVEGYSSNSVEDRLLGEGTYHDELELVKEKVWDSEIVDTDITIKKIESSLNESEKEDTIMDEDERVDYYKEYYENLSPSNFKVKKEGDQIIITIKS